MAALPLVFLFGFDALKQLHYTGRLNLASGVYSLLDEKAKAKIQKKHLLFIPCKTESGGYEQQIDAEIDIENLIGWKLKITGSCGSGSIAAGEDEDQITFDIHRLLTEGAIGGYKDLTDGEWAIWPDSSDIPVTPGEGDTYQIDELFYTVISPDGETLPTDQYSIKETQDNATSNRMALRRIELKLADHLKSEPISIQFDTEELDTRCIGDVSWGKDSSAEESIELNNSLNNMLNDIIQALTMTNTQKPNKVKKNSRT